MVDFIRGIKAGIAAGIVYGIVYIVFQILILLIYWQSYDILATDMMAVIAFYFPSMIVGGIIAGIILGIIFTIIANRQLHSSLKV